MSAYVRKTQGMPVTDSVRPLVSDELRANLFYPRSDSLGDPAAMIDHPAGGRVSFIFTPRITNPEVICCMTLCEQNLTSVAVSHIDGETRVDDDSSLSASILLGTSGMDVIVEISGLDPGSVYYYKITMKLPPDAEASDDYATVPFQVWV